MKNALTNKRIQSIDTFRGITILVMIFVNDVAGVAGIPSWMKHMPADADAMTFVDIVFPAFLFIVGMSIPFGINNRLARGDSFIKLQGHILWRTLGLLVLGVFMVNGESGYNEKAMGMSGAVWSLLFYLCVILVWNVYFFRNKFWAYLLRTIGAIGLIFLAWVYRSEDGTQGLAPQWWGILGLIGWAYLFSCIIYQAASGRIIFITIAIAFCVAWYAASRADVMKDMALWQWMAKRAGHASHTCLVLCGMVLSLIFFDKTINKNLLTRFAYAALFALCLMMAGYMLRPYYTISKIYATPTWSLYSAAICCILYSILYWFTDILNFNKWTRFFNPAATNPLLVYILPAIIMYFQIWLGLYFIPAEFYQGIAGIAWSLCFSLLIMVLAMGLNKLKIRLQL